MNHQEVIRAYSQIVQSLTRQNKGGEQAIALDFIIDELSLYAIDQNTGSKVLLATNRRLNGQDLFAWQPEQIAYGAMDIIIGNIREEMRGSGAPVSERNAKLIILIKESFSDLALNGAYEPRF